MGKKMLFLDSKNDIARLIFREHLTKELFVKSYRWIGTRFVKVDTDSFGEAASAALGIDLVQCKKRFEL